MESSPKKKQPKRKDTNKKLAAIFSSASSNRNTNADASIASTKPLFSIGPNFAPCTLPEIQSRLKELMVSFTAEIPPLPAKEFDIDEPSDGPYAKIGNQIKSFASQLQQP